MRRIFSLFSFDCFGFVGVASNLERGVMLQINKDTYVLFSFPIIFLCHHFPEPSIPLSSWSVHCLPLFVTF